MHVETVQDPNKLSPLTSDVDSASSNDLDDPKEKCVVEEPPKPKVFLLFFLLGILSQVTFNLAVTAAKLIAEFTSGDEIATNLSRVFSFPCAGAILILCFVKVNSPKLFLTIAISLMLIELISLPLIPSEIIVLVLVGISGSASGTVISLCYSVASQFGPKASSAASIGSGISGVYSTVLMWSLSFLKNEYKLKCYFFFSAFLTVIFLIYFLFKVNQPSISQSFVVRKKLKHDFSILKKIWIYCLAEIVTYLVTFTLFPGYIYKTHSTFSREKTQLIISSIHMVCDFVGRIVSSKIVWPKEKYGWIPSFLRLLFFPIFMLSIQKVINVGNPYWTFGWMFLFSITNGYFGTITMIYGTNNSKLDNDQKRKSGFFLTLSLEIGVLAAMGFTFILPTVPQ